MSDVLAAAEQAGYRPNVGVVLFNRDGKVLVAHRLGFPGPGLGWQLPQGGIDAGEAPEVAVLREMKEEIGTDNAVILAEHEEWLRYDLPEHLRGRKFGGRYRGQAQKWFALRFLGTDADIILDLDPHPEFDAWKWVALAALPDLAAPFKRAIYEILVADFARFAVPGGDA